MKQTIYVTGAAGMIGSVFCHTAIDAGYRIIGIDNLSRGKMQHIEDLLTHSDFSFFHADVASERSWANGIGKDDIILHLADIVGGISYVFDNEWHIFQRNLLINTNLAQIVQAQKPKQLVYVGTACSYPQTKQRSVDESGLTEDDKFPADPESGYGWSKLVGDIEYGILCRKLELTYTNIDLHNVYGWPCDFNPITAQAIPSLIYKALHNQELLIWGNGTQGRAFVEVRDVVDAILRAIALQAEGTFMIGPRVCTTINQIAEIVLRHPRVKATTKDHDLTKPTGDIGRFYAGHRSQEVLGWQPVISLEQGINELVDKIADASGVAKH
jgi:GDP-D-mannose 3',5'-epimerase